MKNGWGNKKKFNLTDSTNHFTDSAYVIIVIR